VLAFRGPASLLTQSDTSRLKPEDRETAAKVAAKLKQLRATPGIERLDQCSIAMRAQKVDKARVLPELTIVGAEACAEAIRAVTGLEASVKHPNDVLIGALKVAGVLGEASEGRVVLGIGINANIPEAALPAEVRIPATSLLAETGAPVDRIELLVQLLAALERRYDAWRAGK